MKTTLLIMAAGIGSRFGGGIKQLAPVGPNGEIIMDYSIHDAIKAGFNKVVFIIRKDIEKDFREIIGNRIEAICADHGVEIGYAFQALDALPAGYSVPEGRSKPWGTGQAVLAAKDLLTEPFVVINADDYYGKVAFKELHNFLVNEADDTKFCMAGFQLKNTLSDNGGVTRGVCQVNADNYLTDVVETGDIVKTSLLVVPLLLAILQFQISEVAIGLISLLCFIVAFVFFCFFIMGEKEKFANTVLRYGGLWQRLVLICCYVPLFIWCVIQL